ncbi:MAG: zinc ribbon domain-containing protein [Flavobacteriales bacterium]
MSINLAADTAKSEVTVEEKLKALYKLQSIDTKIDKIKIVRGELPLEVQDLEDELIGLETRISNLNNEVLELEHSIADRKNAIKESQALIKKYEEQQNNVRNNREYDSLNKEIEYQTLDIELSNKRIREFTAQIDAKKQQISHFETVLEERKKDLDIKKGELNDIISETQKEEQQLMEESKTAASKIEDRLLVAYKKIRENSANGLAVVSIERDACGGCFNQIPPQRQMDIRLRKKIIVCEYCGRILVDPEIPQELA